MNLIKELLQINKTEVGKMLGYFKDNSLPYTNILNIYTSFEQLGFILKYLQQIYNTGIMVDRHQCKFYVDDITKDLKSIQRVHEKGTYFFYEINIPEEEITNCFDSYMFGIKKFFEYIINPF